MNAPSSRSSGSRRTIEYPPMVPIPFVVVSAIQVSSLERSPDYHGGAMLFTEQELEFLRSQRLCRLATVSPTGWPQVVPVMYKLTDDGAFEFDADGVKLRNLTVEPRSALVVDGSPKRGVSVQGRTEVIGHERARHTLVRTFSRGV